MPEINPLTNNQIFLKKIAENTGSDYDTGDVSEINPLTIDQILLKEIAANTAGQSGDITELEGKVADNTAAIEAMVNENGCCNIMPNNAVTTTVWGVTFTVNSDKTITVSGTPGQRLVYIPMFEHYMLKAGTYVLSSGLPSSSYIFISLSRQSDSVEIAATTMAEDGKFEFTLDADTEIKGAVGCYVPADIPPVSGVIKPMLYDARLNPTGYVPYAMTNRELTKRVATITGIYDTGSVGIQTIPYPPGFTKDNCTAILLSSDSLGKRYAIATTQTNVALDSSNIRIYNENTSFKGYSFTVTLIKI